MISTVTVSRILLQIGLQRHRTNGKNHPGHTGLEVINGSLNPCRWPGSSVICREGERFIPKPYKLSALREGIMGLYPESKFPEPNRENNQSVRGSRWKRR
jgi:hypothetical protein